MNELAILAVLALVSAVMIVYSLLPSRKTEEEHLERRMSGKGVRQSDAGEAAPSQSAARQVLEKVAPYAMKPVMPQNDREMNSLRLKLAQAGFRRESAVRYFLASKTIVGVALLALTLVICLAVGQPPKTLFGAAGMAGGLGFMFPNLWLSSARSRRREKIRNGLPDSLDLLVVSVEAGLGLDAAVQKVADEMHNVHVELSEELQIATLETQVGVPRAEALENMAKRCGVDEMQSLVSVIIQAERFGTSVAKALRTQADTLRVKRRLKAEERAQKTTVKLMLPLIVFIFPLIFVVLVGPAAMRLVQAFSTKAATGGR